MRAIRTGLALGALAALVAGGAACNAIFGIREGTLDPDAGAASSGGGAGSAASSGAGGGAAAGCPPHALPAQCDAKYLSDSNNCCIPGRSCQGGKCDAGKCQPVVVVADATTDARGIGVAGDRILWATGCTHQIRSVGKDGSNNVGLPSGAHCTPTLAVGGDHVYWIEWDGPFLNTVPVDGSMPAKVVAEVPISGAKADFARLAVDGKNAYWAMGNPASVWFAPLSGDHVTAVPLASDPSTMLTKETAQSPYGVAVDATHVYWADEGANVIKRRALSSLGADTLAEVVVDVEIGPRDIALDATTIYWLTSGGFVRSRPKDGSSAAVTLAFAQIGAESIIVDDRYVYWTNWVDNGDVSRVPKDGGDVEVLASGQKSPWSIAQDCGAIYWTNHNMFNTGEVVRVAK